MPSSNNCFFPVCTCFPPGCNDLDVWLSDGCVDGVAHACCRSRVQSGDRFVIEAMMHRLVQVEC